MCLAFFAKKLDNADRVRYTINGRSCADSTNSARDDCRRHAEGSELERLRTETQNISTEKVKLPLDKNVLMC